MLQAEMLRLPGPFCIQPAPEAYFKEPRLCLGRVLNNFGKGLFAYVCSYAERAATKKVVRVGPGVPEH